MLLHNPLCNREADSRTLQVTASCFVGPLKPIEKFRNLLIFLRVARKRPLDSGFEPRQRCQAMLAPAEPAPFGLERSTQCEIEIDTVSDEFALYGVSFLASNISLIRSL